MKRILKYVLLYIILTILMLGALYLVSFIPKNAIRNNVTKSANKLYYEGEKVYFNSFGRKLFDDNSTDAIMLNLTYTIDEENKLESIVKARRNFVPGVTEKIKLDEVGDLLYENNKFSMTKELLQTIRGEKQASYEYARYWHGYIVVLRILLCFFDIAFIRLLTQITILLSITILMYYMINNTNWKMAIAIFVAFVATDLFVWINTIQGRFVMLIGLIVSIFIANKKINEKNINFWLFISGALTAYFDFLTTPLVSILLPIIIYTAVNKKELTLKNEIIKITQNFIAWGFGYFGLWATKWVIADLLYDMEIIKLSFSQIFHRICGGNKDINLIEFGFISLKRNVTISMNYLVMITYAFLMIYAIIKKICLRKEKKRLYLSSKKIPYYICIIVTLAWYFIIAEHSNKHYFFTYKTMVIPLIATAFIVFDNNKKEKLIKEKDVKND